MGVLWVVGEGCKGRGRRGGGVVVEGGGVEGGGGGGGSEGGEGGEEEGKQEGEGEVHAVVWGAGWMGRDVVDGLDAMDVVLGGVVKMEDAEDWRFGATSAC